MGRTVVLEVTYNDAAALKHDLELQLARGGLHVAVDATRLSPLVELTLRLTLDEAAWTTPARLTVATVEAACVELEPAAAKALVVELQSRLATVVAAAGDKRARFCEAAHAAPPPMLLERRIAAMSVGEKVRLALHGNRDARTLLLRDRAGVVQSSLVRNPQIGLDEVLALARGALLAPDAAETLAQHQTFGASPQVALALVRNPRTPLPLATTLVARLGPAELRAVAKGAGLRAQVAAAARKRLLEPKR